VTAADNDDADGDENDETEVTYDGENANWRINGACRSDFFCQTGSNVYVQNNCPLHHKNGQTV